MPTETDPETLEAAQRAFLIAPAGCGKTELIARAIALGSGRSLVLTHTHSGVSALRARLRRHGVPTAKFNVATIAGLGLRYASSFRTLSGLRTQSPTGSEWPEVYRAALRLLRHRAARDVLSLSYSGVYVDEYQDCNVDQHRIIMELADFLPCRLLGDHLQGIFDFRGQEPIIWERDVVPHFERLNDLTTPHRWLQQNPALGEWLGSIRGALTSGEDVDLRDGPGGVWLASGHGNTVIACRRASAQTDGTVVAIRKWRRDCPDLASRLGGDFGAMEELDCEALMEFADGLDRASSGHEWASLLLNFASTCFTEVGSRLKPYRTLYAAGETPDTRRLKGNRPVVESLNRLCSNPSASALITAARSIDRIPGAKLYRRELWNEMKSTVGTHPSTDNASFRDTAWEVRDRARRNGRNPENRIVSTTLLVKGLEFSRAVVTDIDGTNGLTAKEIYVAMTRGAEGLTVLSEKPVLRNAPITNALD